MLDHFKQDPSLPNYSARLEASFAYRNGSTVLQHKFHKAPLKIAKTFQREQQQIGVCVMDCSPGLMAGDKYKLDYSLSPHSSVFITNQSYTKVHPSKEQPAYQQQNFIVGPSARLEFKPEPIMLYKDASFYSETAISLEADSVVFFSDILCPGRVLRNEIFQYARYDSRLKVHYGKRLIYYNSQTVIPSLIDVERDSDPTLGFRRLGGWGKQTYLGNLYFFSDRIVKEHLAPLQALSLNYPHLHCGVSLTHQHGIVISALGSSVWELQQLLDAAWALMKTKI